MINILWFCGGIFTLLLFVGIVLVSEWLKLMLDWDGSYLGKSWLAIWREQRAYRKRWAEQPKTD